jgi:hypothetical protein
VNNAAVWSHYHFLCYLMLNSSSLFSASQLFRVCANLVSSLPPLQLANLLWMPNSHPRKPMRRAKMLPHLGTWQEWSELLILRHLLERYCNPLILPSGILM